MASSIFSSERPAPPRSGLALVAGFALAAIFVVAAELSVRHGGLGALTVYDTEDRWLRQRERAARLASDAIVLLGASRMQAGVDLPTLRDATGAEPVQLAISANPVLPVLEHIAADETVTGLIVVSFTIEDLFEHTRDTLADRYTSKYDERRGGSQVAYAPLEAWLRGRLDSLLVSRAAGFHPAQLVDGLRGKSAANYVRTLPDRSQKIDYSRVNREQAYEDRLARYVPAHQIAFQRRPNFDARVRALDASVRRIHERGGRVVLVRFPSSRGIWAIDEIRHPKNAYWDRLADLTEATLIHFTEHPSLQGFDLPDGVHMDQSQTVDFTAALARLLPRADTVTLHQP